jgi:hypothetical protein
MLSGRGRAVQAAGKIISSESVCQQQQLIDAARARAPADYHFTTCAHNSSSTKRVNESHGGVISGVKGVISWRVYTLSLAARARERAAHIEWISISQGANALIAERRPGGLTPPLFHWKGHGGWSLYEWVVRDLYYLSARATPWRVIFAVRSHAFSSFALKPQLKRAKDSLCGRRDVHLGSWCDAG